MPHIRYIAFSYSDGITTRDNNKMVRLVTSPSYRQLWGERFEMTKLGERRIENNMTGYKVATSVGGLATGERGLRPPGQRLRVRAGPLRLRRPIPTEPGTANRSAGISPTRSGSSSRSPALAA